MKLYVSKFYLQHCANIMDENKSNSLIDRISTTANITFVASFLVLLNFFLDILYNIIMLIIL